MFLPPTLGLDGVIIVADGLSLREFVSPLLCLITQRESTEFHMSARAKWPRDYSLLTL